MNLFNFVNAFHCMWVPEFTSIFKMAENKYNVGNRFHVL